MSAIKFVCSCDVKCPTMQAHAQLKAAEAPPLTPGQLHDLAVIFGPAIRAINAQRASRASTTRTSSRRTTTRAAA